MYRVAALLPAWFCYLQFTQRVQVELKWNRPQLCLQLRCHTNKGTNHFKNTPHTTRRAVKNHIIPFLQKHPFFRKKGFEMQPQLAIKATLLCSLLTLTK